MTSARTTATDDAPAADTDRPPEALARVLTGHGRRPGTVLERDIDLFDALRHDAAALRMIAADPQEPFDTLYARLFGYLSRRTPDEQQVLIDSLEDSARDLAATEVARSA